MPLCVACKTWTESCHQLRKLNFLIADLLDIVLSYCCCVLVSHKTLDLGDQLLGWSPTLLTYIPQSRDDAAVHGWTLTDMGWRLEEKAAPSEYGMLLQENMCTVFKHNITRKFRASDTITNAFCYKENWLFASVDPDNRIISIRDGVETVLPSLSPAGWACWCLWNDLIVCEDRFGILVYDIGSGCLVHMCTQKTEERIMIAMFSTPTDLFVQCGYRVHVYSYKYFSQ
jgi:hypothetical protein